MSNDLFLVGGIIICVLALLSLGAALREGRVPRVGAILILAGLVLIAAAASRQPGGYAFADVPGVFARVIGQFTR